VVTSTHRPHFNPEKDPVPILQEVGWAPGSVWTGAKSHPYRDSIPDSLARSSVAITIELPSPKILFITFPYSGTKLLYLENLRQYSLPIYHEGTVPCDFFLRGATAPRGRGLLTVGVSTVTLRHNTFSRAPLDW